MALCNLVSIIWQQVVWVSDRRPMPKRATMQGKLASVVALMSFFPTRILALLSRSSVGKNTAVSCGTSCWFNTGCRLNLICTADALLQDGTSLVENTLDYVFNKQGNNIGINVGHSGHVFDSGNLFSPGKGKVIINKSREGWDDIYNLPSYLEF